jgi:hypothetical protein
VAWTEDERAQIQAAILALAKGERVSTVTYSGPPQRSVEYEKADLPELRRLLAEMSRQLQSSPSYRRAQVKRGWRDG